MYVYINGTVGSGNQSININKVYGPQDDWYIYCQTGRRCFIECLSEYSCYNLAISCDNNCNVSCKPDEGISCPIIISYDTDVPTTIPTLYPTNASTLGDKIGSNKKNNKNEFDTRTFIQAMLISILAAVIVFGGLYYNHIKKKL